MRRQLFELGKIVAWGLAISVVYGIARWESERSFQSFIDALGIYPFMIYALIFTYPVIVLFIAWLGYAHFVAVQQKNFPTADGHRPLFFRILTNRLLILVVSAIGFGYFTADKGSYPITFLLVLELPYFCYFAISKLVGVKANAHGEQA